MMGMINSDTPQRLALLLGRGLLGVYFIIPGIAKITGWSGTVEEMAAHGVPLIPVALVITIILQIGVGASLLIGYRTQLCAAILAALTLIINIYMHDFWNNPDEMQNFIKNLAILAGLLFVSGANLRVSS